MDIYVVSDVVSNEGGNNVGARRTLDEAKELATMDAGEKLDWSEHNDHEWWGRKASGDWMQIDRFEV